MAPLIFATLVFCALVCVSGKTNENDPIVDGLAYIRKSEMNAELKNIDAAFPPRFNGSEIASDCKDGDTRDVCIPNTNQTYVASSYNPATGWHNRSYITCNSNGDDPICMAFAGHGRTQCARELIDEVVVKVCRCGYWNGFDPRAVFARDCFEGKCIYGATTGCTTIGGVGAAIIIIFGILTIMSVCLLVYGVKLIVRDCKSKRGWKWDSSKITAFWCVIGCVGIVFTTIGWWLATLAGSRWYYYALYQVFGLPLLIASLVFAVNTNGLMWIQIAKGAKKLAKGGANLQKKANIFVYVFSIATFLIVIGLVFLGMATMTPGVIIICVWVTAPIYFIGGRGLSKAMKGNPNMKRVDDITRLVLQQGILFSILAVTIMVIFQIEDASNGGYKEPGTLILTFLVIAFMIFMSISMSFLLIQFVLDPKKKNAGDATKSRWWTRSTRRGGETGATGATSVTGSTETGSRTQTGFSASKVGGTTQGDTTKGGGDTTVGDATVGNELATLESGEQEVDLGKD